MNLALWRPLGARRQKRSMGLTVAEVELTRLDQERGRDRGALERERSYAENIITKIEDVLWVAPFPSAAVAAQLFKELCPVKHTHTDFVLVLSASRRATTQTTEEEKWWADLHFCLAWYLATDACKIIWDIFIDHNNNNDDNGNSNGTSNNNIKHMNSNNSNSSRNSSNSNSNSISSSTVFSAL